MDKHIGIYHPGRVIRECVRVITGQRYTDACPILLMLALLVAGCSGKTESTHPKAERITELVYASGIVRSRDQYEVHATVNGIIQEIRISEGDLVRQGDILMILRNEPSLLNVRNAQLAAAHAAVRANAAQIQQAESTLNLARSQLRNDSLLLVRQQNLKAQGVGTQVELEQRQLVYENAITACRLADLRLQELRRNLEFSASQSNTNLNISRALERDYVIRAAVDGKVYKLLREPGELATAQSPVAILGNAAEFLLELQVDEFDIARIATGQRVLVSMDSYKKSVFEARITKVQPLMDEASRSFMVEAEWTTQPPILYPNLTLEANIVIRTKAHALTIPRGYVIGDTCVRIGKHQTRLITVGMMDYERVEVLTGLTESDIIYKP